MQRTELEAKLAGVTKRFDDVTKEKATADEKSAELQTELVRLQGEYRALDGMLQELPESKDPAKTIEAKPKVEAK